MELINEGTENVGKAHIFEQSTIDKWREAKNNPNGTNEFGMPNYMAYPNTDWFMKLWDRDSHKNTIYLFQEVMTRLTTFYL